MSTLRIAMLPKQLEFLQAKQKWAAARGGVGSGKTMAMVWWMLSRLEDFPAANHVVVGSDYEQLRRGFFQSLLGVLEEDLGFERGTDFTYREVPTPMLRFTHNGARLRSMSAELAQRVRSVEIQTLYCEEPQTWHQGQGSDTHRAISSRVRHSVKSASQYPAMPLHGRMTFNPPAVGTWLYELVEKKWPEEGYPCWRFSLAENYLLKGRDEYLRQIKVDYPEERWPVEIDGHWATYGGSVYRDFDFQLHCTTVPDGLPPLALAPKPLLWSLDFNVEWMSSVVAQAHVQKMVPTGVRRELGLPPEPTFGVADPRWQRRVFYFLDELFLHDKGTNQVVDEFLERYGDHARKYGVAIYGDPSGNSRSQALDSTAAARSNWAIVMTRLMAADINAEFCVTIGPPSVMDRIAAVNTQFVRGEDRALGLVIDPSKCPETINDFLAVRFVDGKGEIKKDTKTEEGKKRSHLCLVGETLVETEAGRVPISEIRVGDNVWTRAGLRPVTASALTERAASIMRAEFSDGSSLDLTPNHPVYVQSRRAFVAADALNVGDECVKITQCIQSNSMVGRTVKPQRGSIGNLDGALRSVRDTCIAMCGKVFTGQSRRIITSIISTVIPATMQSKILNAWLRAMLAALGTVTMDARLGNGGPCEPSTAFVAEKHTRRLTLEASFSIAVGTVRRRLAAILASITKIEPASRAAWSFDAIDTRLPETAPVHVAQLVALDKRADVFDLTVAGEHEFFANGILVSNSDAVGYLLWYERETEARRPPKLRDWMAR